jgi:hypothetical protein
VARAELRRQRQPRPEKWDVSGEPSVERAVEATAPPALARALRRLASGEDEVSAAGLGRLLALRPLPLAHYAAALADAAERERDAAFRRSRVRAPASRRKRATLSF